MINAVNDIIAISTRIYEILLNDSAEGYIVRLFIHDEKIPTIYHFDNIQEIKWNWFGTEEQIKNHTKQWLIEREAEFEIFNLTSDSSEEKFVFPMHYVYEFLIGIK
jgi:hypothetical protein